MTKCSTSYNSQCKHSLLFQLLMLHAEKANSELWLHGCSVVHLYQTHHSSASLPAAGSMAPRCQPQASDFIMSNGTTAASSGHCHMLHLVENPLSNTAKPVSSTLPRASWKQSQSPHQRGWATPMQGRNIPPDTSKSSCTFYAALVMTPVWSDPSLSPKGQVIESRNSKLNCGHKKWLGIKQRFALLRLLPWVEHSSWSRYPWKALCCAVQLYPLSFVSAGDQKKS